VVLPQWKYAETEQSFAKENSLLGDEYKTATAKLRELQAREVAVRASASVKYEEVRWQRGERI